MILQPERFKKFRTEFEEKLRGFSNSPASIETLRDLAQYETRGVHADFFARLGRRSSGAEAALFTTEIRAAIAAVEAAALELARSDSAFRDLLRAYWNDETENYARIAKLADGASFELILKGATAALGIEVDDGDGGSLFQALTDFALQPATRAEYYPRVVEFFRDAFESTVKNAADEDNLVNDTNFQKMALCYARLNPPDAAEILARQFAVAADEEQHYEMNLVAGDIALMLSRYPRTDPAALELFLANFDQYEGDAFLMKAQYALWLLRGDEAGALAYVRDPANLKGLEYAAVALADLNIETGIAPLRRRLPELKNAITAEVFREAIARLETQSARPSENDRLIHFFGTVTASERALGAESDNVFLKRAESRKAGTTAPATEVDDAEAGADEFSPMTPDYADLPSLRGATAEALREIDAQYDEILSLALDESQAQGIRESALEILYTLRPRSAGTDIATLLEQGPLALILFFSDLIRKNGERVRSPFAFARLKESCEIPEERYQAIVALRTIDDPRIPALLTRCLDSGSYDTREALLSLGEHRVAEAVPRIAGFLRSNNGQYVAAAARALALIESPEAMAALSDPGHYAHLKSLMKTMEK
ncbi:MAG: hypothetical protein RIF32_10855, partial [Leptospirales bacterium]